MGSGDYYAEKTWEEDRKGRVHSDKRKMKQLLEDFVAHPNKYTRETFLAKAREVLDGLEDPGGYSYSEYTWLNTCPLLRGRSVL